MLNVVVVDSQEAWQCLGKDFKVVTAAEYFSGEIFQEKRNIRVLNLCSSYRYQRDGYYVSLLAGARGHRIVPTIDTVQKLRSRTVVNIASEDLDELIQRQLNDLKSDKFELSVYFGQNVAHKYAKLAREISRSFDAPLLRAKFLRKEGRWVMTQLALITLKDIPENHREAFADFLKQYLERRQKPASSTNSRFSLAILINPEERTPPSNEKAIRKFIKAAEKLGIEAETIEPSDYRRLAEYDALFIRETTCVNHHTFRFAQKARALGMVVIDDPDSIIKCTNKVFLAELMRRNKIAIPKTVLLHRDNWQQDAKTLNFPVILKKPDSSFSQGVVKADNIESLHSFASDLFEESSVIIGQEFMPTDFDWRVGMIDGKPLFVCRYYMSRAHWQIYKQTESGKILDGKSDTLAVEDAPPKLLEFATQASSLIGRGLYGLDVKEHKGKYFLIEINDNPSIDAGVEDIHLKDVLYERIMQSFLAQLNKRVGGAPHG